MAEGTLSRCVERICGEAPGSLPDDPAALDEWIAAHGLKLVEVADPAAFAMAGSFLADFGKGWTIAFGVPPGPIFVPEDSRVPGLRIRAAQVLAPLELSPRPRSAAPAGPGRVTAIAIAGEAEGPMRSLPLATAIAGRGLEGDRYAARAGTFSSHSGTGRDLTLIESEALVALADGGAAIDPLDARRNLIVTGIDLDGLIGRRFRIGAVECSGARRCEPCAHLERLTRPGVLRGLVHRGGLRADIIAGGEIAVGDEIVVLDRAPSGA